MKIGKIDFTSFKTILLAALLVRLFATIFAQGFGMHDDHYLVIEASSSWADGYDYNGWLPWSENNRGIPEGHSFTYVGLNFLFFKFFHLFGLKNPIVLMYINRLFHALASLLVVYFGMKITERLADKKQAVTVGWILALLWVLPFLSVRNLVEMASVPFLIWGCWLLVRNRNPIDYLYAGLLVGVAISFRYQIAIFAIGIAAFYFFKWQWKSFFLFCTGIVAMFCLTQGVVDFLIWGYPFAEFMGYAFYNITKGTEYMPNNNYLMYFLVLMGALLFPLGLLMMVGFLNSCKKYTLIFIPTMAFILFHTVYPNRQERFILSVLPFFIILGVLGYTELCKRSFWNKLWKGSYTAFWVLNIPLLFILSTFYSKKSRVEAMYALHGVVEKNDNVLQEGSAETKPSIMPKFYAGNWYINFTERIGPDQHPLVVEDAHYDYVFFYGEENLKQRIKTYKKIYPNFKLVKKCFPSTLDVLLREINHHNANQYIEVWKTNQGRY